MIDYIKLRRLNFKAFKVLRAMTKIKLNLILIKF